MRLSRNVVAYIATLVSVSLSSVNSECPNGCSGHGLCGAKDMCTCDRNWQGADCSLRTCPFGISHVDIPKGDLDGTREISGHNQNLITSSTVYPYGTTEGFPKMVDTEGNYVTESAHYYAECSNKGLCDRETGECECLPGYDGSACQRASCPSSGILKTTVIDPTTNFINQRGSEDIINTLFSGKSVANVQINECSGHGTCESISKIASMNGENMYDLWDKESSMGCVCDPGYFGPDCSERSCKYGIDPLWIDDTTARVTQTTVRFETDTANTLSGKYALRFFDVFGDDHITGPLELSPTGVLNTVNHCDVVTASLLGLPLGVVPSIECSQAAINTNYGFEYTLKFTGNPGKLRELEIIEYLDGTRPTISVSSGSYTATVHTKVNGEFVDHFAQKCEGVTVKVLVDWDDGTSDWGTDVRPGSIGYLAGLDSAQEKLLKACLGDADYDPDNNVDVANWDKGVLVESDGLTPTTYNMIGAFPHAIKVVPKEDTVGYTSLSHGDYYLVWYDESATAGKQFRVANVNSDANVDGEALESYVFTTKGTVQQMGYGTGTELADNPTTTQSTDRIVGYFDAYSNKIYTNYDTSCANHDPLASPRNHVCVERGDKLFIVDSCWGAGNQGASSPKDNPFFGGPEIYNCADSSSVNYNTGNLYTVTKVYTVPLSSSTSTTNPRQTSDLTVPEPQSLVDTFIIEVDANLGWDGLKGDPENADTALDTTTWSANTGIVTLFHFTPSTEGNYEYVSQCSNRGLCNTAKGFCECFSGYTGDDCSLQNALALVA